MREMILLGAGASLEGGIPLSASLTKALLDSDNLDSWEAYKHVVEYVEGALRLHSKASELTATFRKLSRSKLDVEQVDIESVLRALDGLAVRDATPLSPFVKTWDNTLNNLDSWHKFRRTGQYVWRSMLTSLARAGVSAESSVGPRNRRAPGGGVISPSIRSVFEALPRSSYNSGNEFADAFADAMISSGTSGEGSLFIRARRYLEQLLCKNLWLVDTDRYDYLRPLVRYCAKSGFSIVSLNYDNAIEGAGCAEGIALKRLASATDDSSESQSEKSATVKLLKLHGSLDWTFKNEHGTAEAHLRVLSGDETRSGKFEPAIIFGQENKLTAEAPFFDLFLAFRDELQQVTQLTAMGYSWRDTHVNAVIRTWLRQSSDRLLQIVDPSIDDAPLMRRLHAIFDAKPQIKPIKQGAKEAVEKLFLEKTIAN